MKVSWEDLNERQQEYMKIIFETDQIQERAEKLRARLDQCSRPAEEWRYMEYADYAHGYSSFKQRLVEKNLVDPGTGSTFSALEKRGYILAKYERVGPHPRADFIVYIRLTTKGRKLVRDALGLQAPKALPTGTLQEWHWRALVCVYQAQNADPVAFPRGIGNSTIRRLEDYKERGEEKPLITWVELPCEPYTAYDWHYRPYTRTTCNVQRLTPFGQQYYRENWERYREMYPDVEAPEPQGK